MFRGVATSPLVLFQSESSNPFSLFSRHVDASLPEDSGLVLVHDATGERADVEANDAGGLFRDSRKFRLRPAKQVDAEEEVKERTGHLLRSIVLHMQSPTVRTTFIRIPPVPSASSSIARPSQPRQTRTEGELGITLSYLHLQVRLLGARPFTIEIGIRDMRGQRGRIRVSNFQARPTLYAGRSASAGDEQAETGLMEIEKEVPAGAHDAQMSRLWKSSPLLHLPLATPRSPAKDPLVLTPWTEISLPLAHTMPHLHNPAYLAPAGGSTSRTITAQFDRFESLAYVQVHANCRLRRLWCTSGPDKGQEPELQLYGHS